ncbi:PREDICTED: gibberellin-regulated protein 1 [Tarenaya hassleriana]|uniref:gibberellin-regulated protein 1 n=1 Tax=Tarenaya hassleriana TaxID=28532 RepID=UPI00053C9F45|nr:PREDICTED: gibberellin-regulated protein 1 [Tarenaya hassleriana]
MAIHKALLASLLVSLLVLHLVQADTANSKPQDGYAKKIDCGNACEARCKLSSRPRLCHRACGTCCMRCNCVPAGTAGNYDKCECYAALTTHGGQRKCP